MSFEKISHLELQKAKEEMKQEIGDLSALSTTDKSTLVAAVNETFQSVSNGKAQVASAITDKGVTTASDAAFTQMAQNIRAIQTGITPSGSINISANGTYDVTDKAQAVVNVSGSSPTLITKNITQNGTYNASGDNADGYSAVTVAVPVGSNNSRCYQVTLDSDAMGAQVVFNPDGDPDIAAHRNDNSFVAGFMALFNIAASSTRALIASNNVIHSNASPTPYGIYMRSSSAGVAGVSVSKTVSSAQESSPGTISVDSSGVISAFSSSSYPLRAGTYIVICGW